MGIELLPYLVFFLVPILKSMSDQEKNVREIVANSFAKLVSLMPLESSAPVGPRSFIRVSR